MEVSSRRKACDLCFKKKIRCDSLRPTCSNCVLYKVNCRTTSVRRRPPPAPHQPAAAAVSLSDPTTRGKGAEKEDDSLIARLARIEAKLDGLGNSAGGYSLADLIYPLRDGNQEVEPQQTAPMETSSSVPSPEGSTAASEWMSPRSTREIPVPPIAEALPVVEIYFQDYNSLIPIFDQRSFMIMLHEYYARPTERRRACGAAINVVLAMGYRLRAIVEGDELRGFDESKIKTCVDNAQMMLDELMTRDCDLLGLQCLLALALLFQAHPDQTAAAVLNSAAVRLAHSMRLESKALLSSFSPPEARQRSNVAWVCFMLDKDISLRNITPALTRDEDIDLDLPSLDPRDSNFNLLSSKDGLSQLNLFRAKVQLAHIEGKIYDNLLSNRSRKLSHEGRQQAVLHLDRLLERWKQSIPHPLHLSNMGGSLRHGPLIHMTVLYQTYHLCLTTLHGLYSLDAPWIKSLGGLGTDLLRTIAPRGAACMEAKAATSPAVWEKCVGTSHDLLQILAHGQHGGCNVWLSSCAYFSALTFVFVNLITHPTRETAEEDRKLARLSMVKIDTYFDLRGLEKFRQLRHVLLQLQDAADAAMEASKRNQTATPPSAASAASFAQDLNVLGPAKYPWEGQGFRPLLLPPGHIFDTDFDGIPDQMEAPSDNNTHWLGTTNETEVQDMMNQFDVDRWNLHGNGDMGSEAFSGVNFGPF